MATKIQVDYENNSTEWIDAARDRVERPDGGLIGEENRRVIRELLSPGGPEEFTVRDDFAEQIRAWAEALPGWDAGDARAPHPLIFDSEADGPEGPYVVLTERGNRCVARYDDADEAIAAARRHAMDYDQGLYVRARNGWEDHGDGWELADG